MYCAVSVANRKCMCIGVHDIISLETRSAKAEKVMTPPIED